MTKRLLLLDGDIIIYQIASSLETPIHWGDGLWTLHTDENLARRAIDNKLHEIQEELEADGMIIALSDVHNFRYDVYAKYKHNRKGKRSPMLRKELGAYVCDNYKTFLRPGLEGDDVLGILATSPVIVEAEEKIIVSEDKDLKTIPGKYVNLKKYKLEGIHEISEGEAAWWHMMQTLTGDVADGYPGCPSYGIKTAEKLLKYEDKTLCTYDEMWPLVVSAYESKGLSQDVALQMARVARICQREDYDFMNRRVILWQPPK